MKEKTIALNISALTRCMCMLLGYLGLSIFIEANGDKQLHIERREVKTGIMGMWKLTLPATNSSFDVQT